LALQRKVVVLLPEGALAPNLRVCSRKNGCELRKPQLKRFQKAFGLSLFDVLLVSQTNLNFKKIISYQLICWDQLVCPFHVGRFDRDVANVEVSQLQSLVVHQVSTLLHESSKTVFANAHLVALGVLAGSQLVGIPEELVVLFEILFHLFSFR
jgi:hypothetical protein